MKGEGYIKYKGEAMTLSFKHYPRQLNSVENPSQTGEPEESHPPHSLCIFHSFLSFQHLQQDHFSVQTSSAFSEMRAKFNLDHVLYCPFVSHVSFY